MNFEKGLKTAPIVSIVFLIIVFLYTKDDEIRITYFKGKNSIKQNNTFQVNETVTFNVFWHIPKDVPLKGVAELTLEGKSKDGGHWSIKDQNYLLPYLVLHNDGCYFHEKIPRWAKPNSFGTATVELKVNGQEKVKEFLIFKIRN